MGGAVGMRRRLARGLGSQVYGQSVQVLIRFGEVPLLLHFWGAQLYGEWLMLAAVPAYLSFGDGGFAGAASRDMSMLSGSGNRGGALTVFQSTAVFLAVASLALVVLAFIFLELAPLARWFGFQDIGNPQVRAILLFLILHVVVGFQGGLINGGFWCSGSYPMGMAFESTTQLLEFAALASVVALGGGPVLAAGAYLAGRIAGTFTTRLALTRATPWLYYGLGSVSFKEIRRLTGPAFASLAFPLGNALNIQGMRLIVGIVLGPMAVAVFAPLRTLSNLAVQPRAIVNRLIQPELGFAFGAGNRDLFSRLFLRGSQASFWLCSGTVAALVVVGPWFWPIWTNGKVHMSWALFVLLLMAAVANSVWYTSLMVPYATNRHGRIAVFYSIVYGAGAIAIAYVGLNSVGMAGAGFGALVAEVAMTIYVLPIALGMAKESWSSWLVTTLRPPPLGALWALISDHGLGRQKRRGS